MTRKPKLELTWIGKEHRPKLEPRISLEGPEKSYHAPHRVTDHDLFDNRLIFGDNLLALKALEQEFTGKIKCVYIDPPYNTRSAAIENYDDNLEHSQWLSLMKGRLELLWKFLCTDGLLAVQIDDNEFARLFLLMAEVCEERNLKVIVVKMAEPTGVKMTQVIKTGGIPKLWVGKAVVGSAIFASHRRCWKKISGETGLLTKSTTPRCWPRRCAS